MEWGSDETVEGVLIFIIPVGIMGFLKKERIAYSSLRNNRDAMAEAIIIQRP